MKVTSCFILILIHWTVAISPQIFEGVVQKTMCDIRRDSNCTQALVRQDIKRYSGTAANANAKFLCRGPTTIALKHNNGIFVVEYLDERHLGRSWEGAIKGNGTITGFGNLTEGGTYKFRFHRIFKDGISDPEITVPINLTTFETHPGGDKVKNISLKSLSIQANNPLRMESVISFVPSEYRPCWYNVILRNTTHELKYDAKLRPVKFESVFSDLEFDKDYTISIRSFSGQGVNMTFRTPTCLKMHNNSTVCAPDKDQAVHSELIDKSGNIAKNNLTETETDLRNSNNIGMISVSSSGFVLGICVFAYCRHRKRNQRQLKSEDSETLNLQHYSTIGTTKDIVESVAIAAKVQGLLTPVDEYEIEPDRLEIKQPLGSGAFGIVKLGSLRDDRGLVTTVAVKMLPDNPTEAERGEFQREIKMMKLIRQHRNIVSILGCCTIGPEPLLIVEYCSQGDLQSFLRAILAKVSTNWVFGKDKRCVSNGISIARSNDYNSRIPSSTENRIYDDVGPSFPRDSDTVTMIDLLNFGHQVARGMEFLSSNRIVHRDLAARNVLVCDNKAVKISDFGLSRDVYLENIYTKRGNGRLPIKWMAIEALTHQVYDTSSDVWSFGILLWEIITLGSTPYPTISPAELLKWLKLGYRMEQPENCSLSLYNLMLACWQAKPQDRPTFTTLREELNELIRMAKENDYLEFEDGSKEKLAEEEDPHF